MLFRKGKKIAAIIMAVVLMITTANFVPESTKANDMAGVGTPTDAIETVVEETTTEVTTEVTTECVVAETEITTEEITTESVSDEMEATTTESGTTEDVDINTTEAVTTETTEKVATETDFEGESLTSQIMFLANDAPLNRATGVTVSDKITHYCDGNELTQFTFSNGQIAICMEFTKTSAGYNSSIEEFLVYTSENTSMAYKVMYYGYNGPEQWSGFGSESNAIVGTGVLLSYLTNGNPTYALNSTTVSNFYSYIQSAPTPPKAQMSFSPSSVTTSVEDGVQKTSLITYNADSRLSVTLKLDGDMTLYFDGSTTPNTGNVTIKGGQKFYITAPLTRDTDFSQTVIYSGGKLINVMQAVPAYASSGVQKMAYSTKQSISANLAIDFEEEVKGSIKVHKKPSNEEMANTIPCYNDLTATFGVYSSYADAVAERNSITTFTTNSDGEGSVTDLPLGTYYVKELISPPNYKPREQIYVAEVNSPSVPVEFDVINYVYFDPLEIVVEKTDDNGNRLSGAEFTIKYYGLQQDSPNPIDPATLGYSPIRTWVLKSDENGQVKYRESHKISGDEFYKIDGFIGIPIGTITIQETKAPAGYVIDPTVRVQSVRNDVDLEDEHYYNTSVVPNTEFKAYIKIIKKDNETKQSILNNNATFKIWSYDDNAYVSFTIKDVVGADIVVDEFETDDSGVLITPDVLLCGEYRIDEIENPIGYYSAVTSSTDLTISTTADYEKHYDDNGNVITDMGTFVVEIENTSVKGYIEINKKTEKITWNPTLGKYISMDKPASDIKFNIYADEDIYTPDGQGILVYRKGDLVTSIVTDDNGYAKTDELYLGEYKINEEVPEGYIAIEDEIIDLSLDSELVEITEAGVTKKLIYETVDVRNAMQQAQIKIYKTDISKTYYLEGAEYSLYEYNADLVTKDDYLDKGVLVSSGITDKNGELLFAGYFPLGDYVAVETEAPEGYVTDEQIHLISAEYDDSGVEYIYVGDSYINDSIKGSINLTKRDMEDKDKTLEGVKFNLYKVVNDESIKFSEEAKYINGFNELFADEQTKVNSFKLSTEDMFIGEYVTDENGEIHIEDLCYGEYYFIETETLYRYNINETPQSFIIDENEVVYQLDVYNDGRIGTLSIWGYDGPGEGGGHHKTGDNTPVMMVFVMAALSLAGILFIMKRKKYAGK